MTELTILSALGLVCVGIAAGMLGALIGLGGGIFITPALIFLFHVPVHLAVPASLGCVAAGALAATPRHFKAGTMNLRIGVVLSMGAATGGAVGGFIGDAISPKGVLLVLSISAALAALISALAPEPNEVAPAIFAGEGADQWPGSLGGTYNVDGNSVPYEAKRPFTGAVIAGIAGCIGSIAGIGGGFINVPQMRLLMKLPTRVAAATSIIVLGTTASAGLIVYYRAGSIAPVLVGPLLVGSTLGAAAGGAIARRLRAAWIHWILVSLLSALAVHIGWNAYAW